MAEKKNHFKKNHLKEVKNEVKTTETSIKSKKKKNKEKSNKTNSSSNLSFFQNVKFQKVLGLFLLALSLFLIISFISYLFAWQKDFDKIHSISAYDLLFNNNIFVNNFGGKSGAVLAHFFITRGFGVASFAFILLFALLGLKLFANYKPLPIKKTYIYSFLLLLWLPVSLGFIFRKGNLMFLQGVYGFEANIWLSGIIGRIGTAILLIFILLTFLIVVFNFAFNFRFKLQNTDNQVDEPEILSTNILNPDNDDENSENIDEEDNLTDKELEESTEFTVVPQDEQKKQPYLTMKAVFSVHLVVLQ